MKSTFEGRPLSPASQAVPNDGYVYAFAETKDFTDMGSPADDAVSRGWQSVSKEEGDLYNEKRMMKLRLPKEEYELRMRDWALRTKEASAAPPTYGSVGEGVQMDAPRRIVPISKKELESSLD